jgi:tetratricopeptide (TPR) repeat protein
MIRDCFVAMLLAMTQNHRLIKQLGLLTLVLISTPVFAQDSVKQSEQLDFAQGLLSRGMYDMAILQFQKFITDYPHSESLQDAYLSLGEVYFLSGDFNKAVDTFNQFNQRYPHSDQLAVSILRLGQIDLQLKKYDEALKEFTSIDEQHLKGQVLQSFDYFIAKAYLGLGDNASALSFFQKASGVADAADYTADAYKEVGKIQSQGKHFDEALNAYASASKFAKDDALKGELSYRMAELEFLSGKFDEAIKGFEQVIEQNSKDGFLEDALANMLLAYFNLGEYDQLLSAYKKNLTSIKDEDAYFATHYSAVLAYIELKQYDQANALLDRMLAMRALKAQEKAKIFIKKADILIRQKKYKDSQALLDASAAENTGDADEALFLKAQAYYGLGDYDHAFNFFENVYLNFPNSHFSKAALLGEAHARQETGRYKESEGLFLKYVDIQDQIDLKSEALYDAVMMAVKAGDLEGVISSSLQYIKNFPQGDEYSEVLLILADSYGKSNQPQEAINLLQGYVASPASAARPNAANFLLGYNYQLLGKSDLALEAYKKVDQHKEDGKFYLASLKNMAIIYLTQRNFDQARICFDRLISQADPNDLQIKTYIWVCNEYLKEQKFDDVLRIAAQAEGHFSPPDLLEIKYFKAEALRVMGNCSEAEKNYALVTSSASKNAYTGSAHIGDGLCLAGARKFDEAKQEFQKSLDENAEDYTVTVHARFEIANADLAQGNLDEALKFYLLVATIYDDAYYCPESLLRAAKIFEQQKHPQEALKMYAEILSKYSHSAAADMARERVKVLK